MAGMEAGVGQGCGEVGDRLAFDQDLIVDQVVPGRESDHLNLEGASLSYDVEQRRLMFRVINIKSVKLTGHGVLRRSIQASVTALKGATTRETWRGNPGSAIG